MQRNWLRENCYGIFHGNIPMEFATEILLQNCYGKIVMEFAIKILWNSNCNKTDVLETVIAKLLPSLAKHFATIIKQQRLIKIFSSKFYSYSALTMEFFHS